MLDINYRHPATVSSCEISPRKSEVRSVGFEIPSKRQKIGTTLTAKELIDEINSSYLRDERMLALWKAKTAFNHDMEAVHNHEISERVDVALVKQLSILVFSTRFQKQSNTNVSTSPGAINHVLEEASRICDTLEMVYRASSSFVGQSFERIGNDLLQLLTAVVDLELTESTRRVDADLKWMHNQVPNIDFYNPCAFKEDGGHDHADQENCSVTTALSVECNRQGTLDGDTLLIKATKILGHFARVGKVTKQMAHSPGLLSCMVRLIKIQPYDSIPWEARLSVLWTLANLACNPSNMQMMMCTPGLVRSLIQVGCRALDPEYPMEVTMEILRSWSISARAFFNLSWSKENKASLSENPELIEMLTELAVFRKSPVLQESHTVQEILLRIRCHAVGTLSNLADGPRRVKIALCEYNNGCILDILTDIALNDVDSVIHNRAYAAIHNLATHDTAAKMVNQPALVLALKSVLLSTSERKIPSIRFEGVSKGYAYATLHVLEHSITPDMACYDNLRELLSAVNPTVTSDDDDDTGYGLVCV